MVDDQELRKSLKDQREMAQAIVDDCTTALGILKDMETGTLPTDDDSVWLSLDQAIAPVEGTLLEWRSTLIDLGDSFVDAGKDQQVSVK
jgi:hypothetical protein